MRWTIETKSAKFEGYSRYERDLLLIDDQWPSHDLAEVPAVGSPAADLGLVFGPVRLRADRSRQDGSSHALERVRRRTRRFAQWAKVGAATRGVPPSRRPDYRRRLEALADTDPGNGRTAAELIRLASSLHEARAIYDRFESAKARCHPYAPACALARLLIGHDELIEGHELLVTAQDEADGCQNGRQYDTDLHEFFLVEEECDG